MEAHKATLTWTEHEPLQGPKNQNLNQKPTEETTLIIRMCSAASAAAIFSRQKAAAQISEKYQNIYSYHAQQNNTSRNWRRQKPELFNNLEEINWNTFANFWTSDLSLVGSKLCWVSASRIHSSNAFFLRIFFYGLSNKNKKRCGIKLIEIVGNKLRLCLFYLSPEFD